MRRLQFGALTLTTFVLMTGCTTGQASWELTAVPPEGRPLIITHDRADDAPEVDVTETDDSVTITATVKDVIGPQNMALETDTVVIELDQPLGDRQLLGCRDAPCDRIGDSLTGHPGHLALDRGLLTTGLAEPIALDPETGQPTQDDDAARPPLHPANPREATVPVGDQRLRTEPTGLFFEEADGTIVWKHSLLPITVPTVTGSLVVLGVNTDDGPEVWAFDLTTGDPLWQRPMEGDVVAAGPAHVVTTRRPDVVEIGDLEGRVTTTTHVGATVGDVLVDDERAYVSIYRGAAAIDLTTGELLWWYSAALER